MAISKNTIAKLSEMYVAKKNIPETLESLKTTIGFQPEDDISVLVNMICSAVGKSYGDGLKDASLYVSMGD